MQAILSPTLGFGTILFLTFFYFLSSKTRNEKKDHIYSYLITSSLIVAVVAIVFFFNPFSKIALPASWTFLKSPIFTPVGTPIDLVLFLGFFVTYGFTQIFVKKAGFSRILPSVIIALALILSVYSLFRPLPRPAQRQATSVQPPVSIFSSLPPYSVSWNASIETLKSFGPSKDLGEALINIVKTPLFGVGLDNFSSIFTRAKTPAYNTTPLWNVNYTYSRSFILQLLAETGILGTAAFVLVILAMLRAVTESRDIANKMLGYYFIAAFILFPVSVPLLFLFFIFLSQVSHAEETIRTIDLSDITPAYGGIFIVVLIFVGAISFLSARSYTSEYYFKRSLDGFAKNNAKTVYDNMRLAVVMNPYIERFRISFSQVNLLIANNIAARTRPQKEGEKPKELTAQERQNITQAIQASIGEAKAAVALNPQRASNWENLAVIYRNIINAVQGANNWTIASYQRAIALDPQNPALRFALGQTYYALNDYENAVRMFELSAGLKPDWPNARYNLAWSNYQKKDYGRATTQMEAAVRILSSNKNSPDLKKAKADLEDFKKKLAESTPATAPGELALPTPPATKIDPKLQLNKQAEPPREATPTAR